ncbi:F-box/kelch-repeat protein At3g23880-like [Rhododendron vialii]|uniref:F-box/kelch-repeat protein At3g23880-like n=1 Tax=Rhododendron vialii TaxID=182163 RepID=UPI00265E5020|nr:F-box/kelch-repeat protein At3g23880-like [Rhododendron vialii]
MATERSSNCREPKMTMQTSHGLLSTEDSLLLPDLPPEIIFQILPRLPVKSLLRFRCVSKSWRSLISQPQFVKTHLSLASKNTSYAHHRLILTGQYPPSTGVKSCSLYSILNEQSDTAVDLDCPLKGSRWRIMVVGCCDGLVCIAAGNEVCIWNPSTRKSKRLPNARMPYLFCRYGFGYDESIDDCKVVGFFSNSGAGCGDVKVKLYTSKTDWWRSILDSSDFIPWNDSGIYVKGALHCAPWGRSCQVIVSLDLAKEKFGEVLQPDYGDGHSQSMLAVVSGCLCVVRNYDGACVDVWMMKEYDRRESWIKLVVIPYGNLNYSPPLCILKNGEVLLHIQKRCVWTHLVRYNPKDVTFTYPTLHNCPSYFVAYPYIESLVLLDTLGFDCNTTS